jgi:acetyl/propionyl-CoA carboxylase alpha subunit
VSAIQRPFERLAIVNRGEAAMRAIHAVRELNEERADPIRVIALHTETERHALFVRQSDERHCIGPAAWTDAEGRRSSAYLDYDALERALVEMRADAAWVGWGFVAEHPEFAELCERLGIVFAGPDASVMRALGDKVEAKRLAEEAGVPVAPWSGGPVEDVEDALRHADAIGYPLMIKAAAGGGGRGMRRVERSDELRGAFERARTEAAQSFGDPTVLMERVVAAARHVEVQLMADGQGGVWALGVRDCSYQRRHQKVVEESASPALTAEQERQVSDAAVRLARLAGYRGAATVEFLYEPVERRFSFMEVNTRLQVEHPITEEVVGIDLVRAQLAVAAGSPLPWKQDDLRQRGHAIEVRIYAEDPEDRFLPQSGRIAFYREPSGPGVRVDAGVTQGTEIGVNFDPMLAKLICHAESRDAAIDRLDRALRDYIVLGTKTNISWLRRVVTHPAFRDGRVSTRFLDDHAESLRRTTPEAVPAIASVLSSIPQRRGVQRSAGVASVWDAVGSWGRG